MERRVSEVFNIGVPLVTIENNSCEGCFFNNADDFCTREDRLLLCSPMFRKDNKSVIFKKMEERTIKLTLEKAKEFYKKGGEFKDLALSAFTEEELTKVELPKTWEEFCSQFEACREYYIDKDSSIEEINAYYRDSLYDKNVLPSKKAAEQHLALMQLHQLRDRYRQGWKPDLTVPKSIFAIFCTKGKYSVEEFMYSSEFLSFQSKEIAQVFLDNFKDLIRKAGDLI